MPNQYTPSTVESSFERQSGSASAVRRGVRRREPPQLGRVWCAVAHMCADTSPRCSALPRVRTVLARQLRTPPLLESQTTPPASPCVALPVQLAGRPVGGC